MTAAPEDVASQPPLPRWLRCPPPAALWALVPPIVAAIVWATTYASLSAASILRDAVAGAFAWSLIEYLAHRFLLHAEPKSPRLRAFNLHLRHHADPDDLAYQVIPFWVTLPVVGMFVLASRALLGTAQDAALCTASGLLSYLAYEYVHLHVHLPGGGRVVRALRRHHLHHHHVDSTGNFGFTSPLWDVVFRTHRRRGAR